MHATRLPANRKKAKEDSGHMVISKIVAKLTV